MASLLARHSGDSNVAAGRREALLDVAARMVARADVDAVTMESVATAAGVSRPLVYKHFSNRKELLNALFERESDHLHRQLSRAVLEANGLEQMLCALIEGALTAQDERGATFVALAAGGGRPTDVRDVQRRRDSATLRHFTRQAVKELGIDQDVAATGMRLVLGSVSLVLDQYRREGSSRNAAQLADTYVALAMGGLRALSEVPHSV
jgi:AcrR family transcriptional regulator